MSEHDLYLLVVGLVAAGQGQTNSMAAERRATEQNKRAEAQSRNYIIVQSTPGFTDDRSALVLLGPVKETR